MPYNTKTLKTDYEGSAVPQAFSNSANDYEALRSYLGALYTRQLGISEFANGCVTVTSAPIELKAGVARLSGRSQIIIYPPSIGAIFWGTTGVTPATGAPLAAGGPPLILSLNADADIQIFAVSDGTDRDIRIVEFK